MNQQNADPKQIWGDWPTPADGEVLRLDVGTLTVWMKGVDNEIWLASEQGDGPGPNQEGPPDEYDWSRWAMRSGPHALRVVPALPDRALVVKPDHPFTLARRASARIYMGIPAWVRVESKESARGRTVRLAEIPTSPLSDTWWGDFKDGELAFWLPTKARRALAPTLMAPDMIISVVQLDNQSEDDLPVEKLLLRVEHLSIYEKEGKLWAEEVRVQYHGEDEGSDIHMDDHPPAEAKGAREITSARTQSRSFKARTFARLRALSGFGG